MPVLAAAQVEPVNAIPTGARWKAHLVDDLLPFWTMPPALGSPVGAFPATRCDDGSLVDPANPCAPIAGNSYLTQMIRSGYLVTQSRQTYGYGVAFHLTGDPKYLGYMKAGIDYLRGNLIDPAGGMFTTINRETGEKGPRREIRNPQELGYGLLSLAMYYYLTRDETVRADLVRLKNYIFTSYYNPQLGAMQWLLAANGSTQPTEWRLVANLDQMNTYLVLMAPILTGAEQEDFLRSLTLLSHSLIQNYYSPRDNLFFLNANRPQDRDLGRTGTDFGHSAKALWMMRFTRQMTGDEGLMRFAEQSGLRLFDRAYLPEDGSWAQGVNAGGTMDRTKSWWIYNELDQYASTLGLADLRALRYLPRTADYWFRNFVDPAGKEVWNGVTDGTNAPIRTSPKAWQWKSAYHSLEHALVGYVTAQLLQRQPVELHYAFQRDVDQSRVHPYFFRARLDGWDVTDINGTRYQKARFVGGPPDPAPAITVTSGASFLPGPVAPGSIATAFGSGLAVRQEAALRTPLPVTLGGATVTITDAMGASREAGLFYADTNQVNFLVPESAAAGWGTATFSVTGGTPVRVPIRVVAGAPALFQANPGTGLVAGEAIRQQGTAQTREPLFLLEGGRVVARPIGVTQGEVYLTLYGTGLRGGTVTATVAHLPVPVTYAGLHPVFVGLDQVNIGPLPRSLAGAGPVTLLVVAGGQTGNPVELAIQ
jgi:uncharacterized protein (TIGR03437 family)